MATWSPRANEIFLRALELGDPEARIALVDEACREEPELRDQVRSLLDAGERAGSFLDRPAVVPGTTGTFTPAPRSERAAALPGECAGTQIGPYKLLQQIGEGGMGTVYMAEQTTPVQRKVALKVIKAGMDSRQVIARFEAERQALAMMDHVNIARVLDGGTTDSGLPYFVMELVRGIPITKYCDNNHLSPRERLELFVPVCQAIQHAHQKGIIHRDIKPSNVMITLYDGKPVPKVIDFGVAKATEQKLTERTLFTQYGTMVGTLEYMSPEQAEMSALGVDTRSDIYSLGVLLYELLTGSTPLTHKRMKDVVYAEILRMIREEEPPKPSTRLSDSGEALASISANRHMEPAKLTKLVRGELDWIVMKTLEKDRGRRYETANAFADDVQRYLNDETVQACPPSANYKVRKFARRNKRTLAMVAVVAMAVLITAASLGWSVRDRKAREQEIAHETARKLALTEQGIREALDRGTKSGTDLHAILKKPGGVQQLLNQPARWELLIKTAQGELTQARQLAVRAEGNLDSEFTQAMDRLEQQLTSDQADYDLARRLEQIRLDKATWVDGGFDYRTAADEYPKAFASFAVLNDDPVAVAARLAASPIKDQLVAALDDWARVAFVLRNQGLTEQLLAFARQAAPDPAWGDRLRQITVWRDQEALAKLVAQAPAVGLSPQLLGLVGLLLRDLNSPLHESWLRLAQAEHPADFWLNFNLAHAIRKTNAAESAGFCRVAIVVRPGNSAAYNRLGIALRAQQKLPEAIAAHHKAITLNPNDDRGYNHLGNVLHDQKKPDEAIAAHHKAIALNPKNASAHTNIGTALADLNKQPEAIAAYHRAIELDPKYALAHYNLGVALAKQKQLPEAIASYHRALEIDPKDADALNNLGVALKEQGKLVEAIAAHRKAIELDPKSAVAHNNLAVALSRQSKPDEAIAAYRKAIELDPKYATAHHNLGIALAKQKKLDEAIGAYRKALELDPKRAKAHYDLGNALLAQKKPDEAIAAYRKAIEYDPKHASTHYNLGIVLSDLKRLDEAIAAFRAAIELDPKHINAHIGLGLAHRDQEQLPEAITAFHKAIELDPKSAEAHNNLAWLLATCPEAKFRDTKRAVELAKKAVELKPQEGLYWTTLGVAHYRAKGWKEATEAMKQSMERRKGGDSNDWFFLSMSHWQLGNKEAARKWYDQAVQWMVKNQPMNEELRRFRVEAAELLGVEKKKD